MVESTSSIQSDEIGNITNIDGIEFFWDGRQLQGAGENGTPYIRHEYNIDGQRTKKTVTDFDTGETTTTEYFYNGSTLAGQKTGSDVLVFMYDESGDMFGFTYNGTPYYYVKNAQNDVWAVTNADGQAVALYFYDAWGDVAKRYEADGYEAIAEVNPILYRSYYCDLELGFYYLNTRYYAPTLHRFLNADGLIDNRSVNSQNLFSYCANNPTNYTDSSGQAWYHWALAATIVVGCALAVVATAGGAAAGIAAVASVASGYAAATTTATVAAGAFIGSAVALGTAAVYASMTSSSTKEFADKGNWGTVAGTAAGAAIGGTGAYISTRTPTTKIYRSISNAEAQDLKKTLQFNLAPGGMESKQFGFNLAETRAFGNRMGQSTIVSAKVPTNMLGQFYQGGTGGIDTKWFPSGTLTIYGDQLDAFNQAVGGTIKIMH